MGCNKEVQVKCIVHEIDNSATFLINQKNNAINAIKLYLVGITGLLGYAAYVQTKIHQDIILGQNSSYVAYSIFGLLFAFLIFILGWTMLSYLSHIIASITKSHKHISAMRYLKSKYFLDNSFTDNAIMPTSPKSVPAFYSDHLPVIFSMINFSALLMFFYFLQLSFGNYISFWVTSIVLAVFAIFYPTACSKFYKQMIAAHRVLPGKNEHYIISIIDRKIRQLKVSEKYKKTQGWIIFFYVFYFIVKIFGIILFLMGQDFSIFLYLEIFFLLSIFVFRYILERYRVKAQTTATVIEGVSARPI